MANEKVVYETRLHWIIFLRGCAAILLALMLGVTAGPMTGLVIFLLVAWGIFDLVDKAITRATSEFAVTDKRVIIKVGWISKRTIEMNLSKIESVDVVQGIFGTAFGYGDIIVVGTGATREPFRYIEDPMQFRKAIQAQQT